MYELIQRGVLSDDSDMTRVSTPDDLQPQSASMRRFLEEDAQAMSSSMPPHSRTATIPHRRSASPGSRHRTPSPDMIDKVNRHLYCLIVHHYYPDTYKTLQKYHLIFQPNLNYNGT